MATKICINGHSFDKNSSCLVCPKCSSEEMNNKYGEEFPAIGAPAFRAINRLGIAKLIDLTNYSEKDLLTLHGFGPKGLKLLKTQLIQKSLSFKKDK